MNNIRIAKKTDKCFIKRLIDENISVDYFSEEKIEDILEKEDHFFFVSDNDNGDIVAMIYCLIDTLDNAIIESCINPDMEVFANIYNNPRVMLYKTTCTDKNFRKNGILTQFMNEMNNATKELDFAFSFVIALVYPDGSIPVHNILTDCGFVKKELAVKPWNKIKSYCRYCKNDYCTCNGMLYIKER